MLNRKLLLCMFFIGLLTLIPGCKSNTISMIVPSGGPQFSQLYMQDNNDYDTTIVEGADPLVAAFGSATYDVIFAPTNLGAKLYDSKSTYQLIASVTWGSFYLASTSEISLNSLNQSEIIAFGKNQTPDAILSYILKSNNIESSVTYLDGLSSVVSSFVLKNTGIYLLSEPALSVLNQTHQINIIDLQVEYETLSGKSSYPQASVFVHRDLSNQRVDQIKADLKNSIDNLNYQQEDSAKLAIKLGIDMKESVIVSATPRFYIKYAGASEAKEDIKFYLELLQIFNPKFIGESLPDETFYR